MTDAVTITGLTEFTRNLKRLDSELPKALRIAFNGCADVVVNAAKPKVPTLTGKARGSVKARSTATASRVIGGGKKVPWYPWLDFGGRVGKHGSIVRPFIKHGRYIYDAYFDNRSRYVVLLEASLLDVARSAGVEID